MKRSNSTASLSDIYIKKKVSDFSEVIVLGESSKMLGRSQETISVKVLQVLLFVSFSPVVFSCSLASLSASTEWRTGVEDLSLWDADMPSVGPGLCCIDHFGMKYSGVSMESPRVFINS